MKTAGKILITGGYGFIGSYVADIFCKEGYQIYIIDDLSTGHAYNVNSQHEIYNMSITDHRCEEIFRSNRFHAVIHLAAMADAETKPIYAYTETNVQGVARMLYLASKYRVSKFIYTSTNTQDSSPYNMSKKTGEEYCNYYEKQKGIKTVILQLAEVYGPRQDNPSRRITSLLEQSVHNMNDRFMNYPFGEDYLYVSDVAYGIYQCVESNCDGTYELSGNRYDAFHSATGWTPKFNLKEGLKRTLDWYRTNKMKEHDASMVIEEDCKVRHVIMPYLENLTGFAIASVVSYISGLDVGYAYHYQLDFMLIYIILIGIVYGTKQVILSVFLSALFQVGAYLMAGRDILSYISDMNNLLRLASYILIGLLTGYIIDRKNRDIQFTEEAYHQSKEQQNFIENLYEKVIDQNSKMENQIISSSNSFAKIYHTTKELDSLEVEDVYYGAINVIEEVMETDQVSLYVLDSTKCYMRLVAKSKAVGLGIPFSVKVDEYDEIKQSIRKKSIYVNRELKSDLPFMLSPIYDDANPVAIIAIHDTAFENLTLHYENLFRMVVKLISRSLTRAYNYHEIVKDQLYRNNTRFLQGEAFEKLLERKIRVKDTLDIDYVLMEVKLVEDYTQDEAELSRLSSELSVMIRETDYLCIDQQQAIYILLSNINAQSIGPVLERLRDRHVEVNIVEHNRLSMMIS